ncbi:biliverdin-producing heme oxygenase [Modestobacter sp. VKM Ac-2986]|uniref:biliverdin-producing heme oxygenase n=1 Tax=Modestobacter sp. VKM Ac-2986 TaxID=3004140 RepID=UPI0022AA3967|nr:biliverdin-producing heme oxygenase [Modestobacter sp. VKM Ac-2986]MCZ2828654.1 biliverdin-producing heme oxygenase [Modestobacter sp. VKM Ac-2986]
MTPAQGASPFHGPDARDGEVRVVDEDRGTDVLRRLRTETAVEHQAVEDTLDLLSPTLTRDRLADVLTAMHGFWLAAEASLDAWAQAEPADAAGVDWPRRRRAALFTADLAALGTTGPPPRPALSEVPDTDAALGRMYVLEGSSLGGVFIDRHLATLPQLTDVGRLSAFSPYGEETGAMWHAFRTVTRARIADGGNADRLVAAARETFGALAAWCGAPSPGGARWTPTRSTHSSTRGNEVVA